MQRRPTQCYSGVRVTAFRVPGGLTTPVNRPGVDYFLASNDVKPVKTCDSKATMIGEKANAVAGGEGLIDDPVFLTQ